MTRLSIVAVIFFEMVWHVCWYHQPTALSFLLSFLFAEDDTVINEAHWFPFHGWCKLSTSASWVNKDCWLLLLPLNKVLLHFHPLLTVLMILWLAKNLSLIYILSNTRSAFFCVVSCIEMLFVCLAVNNFNLCPHLSVGNGDSGKWNSWFEGETSACGRRARIWRGSEWD